MSDNSTLWTWSQPSADQEGVAGNIANLFKNQEPKKPAIISIIAPDDNATLLAREAIQNSWDAAIERAGDGRLPELEISFCFTELNGSDKERLATNLGLNEMHDRAMAVGGWKEVGFAQKEVVQTLGNSATPLRVLKVTEKGTTGMYGPWQLVKSRMYFALITVGYTLKERGGAGGSYGYGKAGLLSASATRTVIAYSCFAERPDDPGVTRRLMGMNYWKPHGLNGEEFTGWGRFGDQSHGPAARPHENTEADLLAASLGLEVRDSGSDDDFGTTFLIIEPTVEPDQLLRAIEVNWWPAVVDNDGFDAEVIDYSGDQLVPRPRQIPELQAFIRSYELAKSGDGYVTETERSTYCGSIELPSWGNRSVELGSLGMVADPDGWSWASSDEDDGVRHRSLVALTRGPRMTVEYYVAGHRAPFIRGTFIANHAVDDLLRQTEPPMHDAWRDRATPEGIDRDAPLVAGKVHERIKYQLGKFRKDLRPPAPERGRYRLVVLENLWKKLFIDGPDEAAPPPGDSREISIHILDQGLQPFAGDTKRVQLVARVEFSLMDHVLDVDELDAVVALEYRFLENEKVGTASDSRCKLRITPPPGFVPQDEREGAYSGRVPRKTDGVESAIFKIVSDPYDGDFATRLIVSAEATKAESKTSAAENA